MAYLLDSDIVIDHLADNAAARQLFEHRSVNQRNHLNAGLSRRSN